MINWAFIWASRRPPLWENCTDVMNLAVGDEWTFQGWYVPVNTGLHPLPKMGNDDRLKKLRAPILDQFESESFKYVIDVNNSGMNVEGNQSYGHLVLKEHLMPNVSLTAENSRVINLDEVYSYLENHSWVALGIPLSNIAITNQTLMAKSYYYTRDKDLNVINLSGDNQPLDGLNSIATVTYCVFKKTKNNDLVTCILNPHLVSIPNLDAEMIGEKHFVYTLDAYDSTIEDYFLAPRIEGNGVHTINKNIIFASTQFVIHDYENGMHFIKHGEKIRFNREVKSNLSIKVKEDRIMVDPTRHFGYISIEYDVDGMINRYDHANRAGKHKIEFIVAKG